MSTAFIRKNTIYLIIFKSCHQIFIKFVAIHSDVTSMLVRKSLKKLMGVFKDFSVYLKNKNININKTDKWKEGDPDIHVKS
jgi:hypothetical protein